MSSSARDRGWGRGWPVDRGGEMVWVRAPISGARWGRSPGRPAPHLHRRRSRTPRLPVRPRPRRRRRRLGLRNRPIRGPAHRATTHGASPSTSTPSSTRKANDAGASRLAHLAVLRWGWSWGGGWSYADPMHFEVLGTPGAGRLDGRRPRRVDVQQRPVPVPPGTPSPVTPHRPHPPHRSQEASPCRSSTSPTTRRRSTPTPGGSPTASRPAPRTRRTRMVRDVRRRRSR